MQKRFVIGLAIVIIILGITFLSLDILDIDEDYKVPLPINIFNTIFIFAPALLLVYLTIKHFIIYGSPELLALGGAQLVLGAGSMFKGWLPVTGIDIPITLHESLVMAAALLHLVGGILVIVRKYYARSGISHRGKITAYYYLGILMLISTLTLLIFQKIIPSFAAPAVGTFSIQDLMQESAALVLFAASLIYFILYYKLHTELYNWYSIGLLLLAFGVLFISLGHVESRITWLGRFSQYIGFLCFLFVMIRKTNNHHSLYKANENST